VLHGIPAGISRLMAAMPADPEENDDSVPVRMVPGRGCQVTAVAGTFTRYSHLP